MAKILIIEDHSDTREMLRLLLELDGYEVTEAHTGEQGIEMAKKNTPNLILMDISLAGEINGLESASRLRADSAFDNTVIIALTAHAMNGNREMTLKSGCDDYITKPIIDFVEFREKIANAVNDERTAKSIQKSAEK